MGQTGKQVLITLVAFVAGAVAAFTALLGIVDLDALGLARGLPMVATMTPMLAVIVFWGVARALGAPVRPAQTFLFGGIAIYALLYLCGRLVAQGTFSNAQATALGAALLFGLAYLAVRKARIIQ